MHIKSFDSTPNTLVSLTKHQIVTSQINEILFRYKLWFVTSRLNKFQEKWLIATIILALREVRYSLNQIKCLPILPDGVDEIEFLEDFDVLLLLFIVKLLRFRLRVLLFEDSFVNNLAWKPGSFKYRFFISIWLVNLFIYLCNHNKNFVNLIVFMMIKCRWIWSIW